MAYPAAHWTTRTVELHKSDILQGAAKAMKDAGVTTVKVKANETTGVTANERAYVVPLHKKNPPSPGPGLGTTAPPTHIVMFCTAGAGSKNLLAKITSEFDDINWL